MNKSVIALAVAMAAGLAACANSPAEKAQASESASQTPRLQYPQTKTVAQVDDYHGTKVADPYRWLEDDNSAETKAWVKQQQALTESWLASVPQRGAIKQRLNELWNYEKFSAPVTKGGRYFFFRNDGLQNQAVLTMLDSLTGEPKVVLDPNRFSADGTVALGGLSVSDDGRMLAYAVADAGSDWVTWKFRDLQTGQDLPDELKWVKFSGASWTPDGKGVYYSRYDAPKAGEKLTGANYHQKVFFHKIGSDQSQDTLVYERPDHKDWGFGADISDDGRYLTLHVSLGTDSRNRFFYKDLKQGSRAPFVELLNGFDAAYNFVGNDGPVFYFYTDKDAPKGRVVAIDTRKPEQANWKTLIPEAGETLQSVSLVHNRFVLSYLKDALSVLRVHHINGTLDKAIPLPGPGTVADIAGKRKGNEAFFVYSSYTQAPTIYRYDFRKEALSTFRAPKLAFNPDDFVSEQSFYTSKDGTRVPIILSYKKGLRKNGQNPTIIYGYGGFDIAITPKFSAANIAWMEMGGIWAVANLRGGSEYGQDWHKAGMLKNKQNVFDDFIAGGEWLIKEGWTSTPKLANWGRSNGGLLAGATLVQRPELWGASMPEVGVLDMLRYHKFTIGWAWAPEYGSADDKDMFPTLYNYSPLHNIKAGTPFPPTFVMTADHDDRVVPAHSFKFAAALQAAQGGEAPVLARIETRAGHGAGKPTGMQIQHATDYLSFLVKALKVQASAAVPAQAGQ